MKHKNIHKIKDTYYIIKNIYNNRINYGGFKDITGAVKQRDLLIKYDWIKCRTTGYDNSESFPKYIVKKDENDKYIVVNKENGKAYGSYDNQIYADIIKKILPYFLDSVQMEKVEEYAAREFYKNITYNHLNKRYYIQYNGYTVATYRNIITALSERDIFLKCEGDEELMCEYTTTINDYSKEKLPRYPEKTKNISYQENYTNKYKLQKTLRNHNIIVGHYQTYELALLIKEYLSKNNWNMNIVRHIINVTQTIQKREKHIIKRRKSYSIINTQKNNFKSYGSYNDIDLAIYVRNRLMADNWDNKFIEEYVTDYYKSEDNQPVYYYDDTDFFSDAN